MTKEEWQKVMDAMTTRQLIHVFWWGLVNKKKYKKFLQLVEKGMSGSASYKAIRQNEII